jgi:hypothetical protein
MPRPRPARLSPLLLALGLVLLALLLAPALQGLLRDQGPFPAWADSDDDDDDGKGKGKGRGHRHKHHQHDHGDDDDDDAGPGQGQGNAPPPEILLATQAEGDAARIEAAGFVILARARLDLIAGELLRLAAPPGLTYEQARVVLVGLAPGASVDRNTLYRPEEFTCGESGCAAFDLVGWTALTGRCDLAPVIGMLDTPVNAEHPGLAGQALERVPLLSAGREAAPAVHGTAIAALLIGAPQGRTPGLLPKARLVAAEVFHRDDQGHAQADAFDLLRGLQLMARRGVWVVNMSFAGPPNEILERGLKRLAELGIGLTAAAGNGGPASPPLYPGAYPDVLAVTAVDQDLRLFSQASTGPHVAFAAPGVKLWTAAGLSGGRFRSGTSYAVPFLTAALAAERAGAPGLPLSLLAGLLAERARDLGEPGRDPLYGWGLLRSLPCPSAAPSGRG